MINKIICLLLGVFFFACQSSFFSFFPIELAKPDLGIPFLVYATFFLSPVEGLITAVVFGFSQELLSNGPAGAMLFSKVGLLLSGIFVKSRLYIESRHTFFLVCTASVLLESMIFLALSLAAKGETRDIFNVLIYSLPNAIVTGFLSIFLFSLFEQFKVRYSDRG
jgi:rod shape-determining protein MreD